LSNECKRKEELPDFIFLDLFMPIQSGYDFLEAYSKKSKAIKSKCKIIVLSILINEDDIQELLRNPDVYTLLQKPLTEESLNALKEIQHIQSKSARKVSEIYN
jgi:CheY-like chemotaxis protein